MRMVTADQWKIAGTLEQGLEFDDNIGLRVDATPAFGYLMRPSFQADWSTPFAHLGVNGRGDIRRYDDSIWDCDNFSLGADHRYTRPRHALSVAGNYARSCSYSQQANDTGILLPNNQSDSFDLSPTWVWQITRRDRVSVSPNYSQTRFSNTGVGLFGQVAINYRNNKSYGVSVSEQHQWDRRLSSSLDLSFSHSEFGGSGAALSQGTSSQDVFGFQIGAQYALSRAWSINAGGGGRWVSSPGDAGGLSFGQTANVAVNYKGRRDSYSLTYSKSVSPSSFGQIQDISSLGMKYGYEFNRELSVSVNGSYSENQPVGLSQLGQPKRDYYEASVELAWKFSRDWRLSAKYRYRMQDYATSANNRSDALLGGMRDSNAITLQINYHWDGLRDAR